MKEDELKRLRQILDSISLDLSYLYSFLDEKQEAINADRIRVLSND